MQLHPLPEEVRITIFMKVFRTGVAQTEVFRCHPSTFEEAMDIALNAEFNFKAARYGTHGHAQSSFDRAELQDVEQQRNIRRCYTWPCRNTTSNQKPELNRAYPHTISWTLPRNPWSILIDSEASGN
uniref:Uncharacterized protein n=1 Tax=Hyaloperonospora arabidopsidis (strain Emoy2) TaxID=559515 RepID=M4B3E9_HYAAE